MPDTHEQFAARIFWGLRKADALNHPGRADTWLQDRVSDQVRKDILDALFPA